MNNTSLVIKNLPKNTNKLEISNIFSKYGNINGINLKKNICFITFNNSFDADNAQKSFNNKSFNGNNLIIEKLSNENNNNLSSNLFTKQTIFLHTSLFLLNILLLIINISLFFRNISFL